MNHWEIFKFHLKRLIKNPGMMGSLFLIPLGMILFFGMTANQPNTPTLTETSEILEVEPDQNVATVIFLGEDNEALFQALIKKEWGGHVWTDRALAETRLDEGKIGAIYSIPSNYLNEPAQLIDIEVRGQEHRSIMLENDLKEIVRDYTLTTAMAKAGINDLATNPVEVVIENSQSKSAGDFANVMTLVLLLILYIFMGGTIIGSDLIGFKKNNTLRRSILSPNEGWRTMGIILISYSVLLIGLNVGLLTILKFIYQMDLDLYLRGLGLILLSVVFSLSSAIALFRVFKNPAIASSIGMLITVLLLGLSFAGNMLNSTMIEKISYISPFKWLLEIFDTGEWLVGTTIILLMSIALFTAGSHKLENYVRS